MQSARIAVLLAVTAVVPWRASAQDARQRQAAAEAYDQGTAAYLAGDYEKAAEWFETANRLAPAAPALIQAARSLQQAGLDTRAASIALRLSMEYPDEAQVAKFAQDVLDQLSGKLLRVDVQCEGCTLDVDGTLQEWPSFFVTPDETHVVTASFETGDRKTEVNGPAGESTAIQFEAPPPKQAPAPASGSSGGRDGHLLDGPPRDDQAKPLPPVVTFVGVGLTAALAIGSVVSTIDMNSGVDEYEQAADASNNCDPDEDGVDVCADRLARARDLLETGEGKETRSTVLWVATGVSAAATLAIALLFTDWDGDAADAEARRRSIELALVPGVRDASLTIKGRF